MEWSRQTPWRQGHLFPEAALALIASTSSNPSGALVISHDCDVAQVIENEPFVEVILATPIERVDGNYTFAKNTRRLHLELTNGPEQGAFQLNARDKMLVEKSGLAQFEPSPLMLPTAAERQVLQHWLAGRYRRSAFPDEFNDRLSARPDVRSKLRRILTRHGDEIIAIYFDLDGGEDVVRVADDDIYSLEVYLIYSSEVDPGLAHQSAVKAKTEIEAAFRATYFDSKKGEWSKIELLECHAVSERSITAYQLRIFKQWYADDISLKEAQPLLED